MHGMSTLAELSYISYRLTFVLSLTELLSLSQGNLDLYTSWFESHKQVLIIQLFTYILYQSVIIVHILSCINIMQPMQINFRLA